MIGKRVKYQCSFAMIFEVWSNNCSKTEENLRKIAKKLTILILLNTILQRGGFSDPRLSLRYLAEIEEWIQLNRLYSVCWIQLI